MNETSLEAYYTLQANRKLQPMELRVLEQLHNRGPLTREEISAFAVMKLSSVCGRVSSLLKAGVIEECGQVLVNKVKQNLVKVQV